MRKYSMDILCLLVILITSIVYFFHLWYPSQKLLVTPDIGTSDAINLSLSQKYVLARVYARGKLPLWETGVGAGFPMFAEGQIGALFLPNIILYRIFPFVTAFNTSLVFAITLISWGTYLWCRAWRVRSSVALLAGITMAFSGVTIPHLTHITLLQGFSLLPIIAWLTMRLIHTPSYWKFFVFAIAVSQQIFAGFVQAAFITWQLAAFLALAMVPKSTRVRSIVVVAAGILAGIGLSAIQILPSREFLAQTTTRNGFNQTDATSYSFRPDNFLTIFQPFAIGNPRDGTYNFSNNSIFWENNIFLGILPIVGIGFWWIKKQKRRMLLPLLLLMGFAAILMMGKYSPAYLVYAFWPMNLFRVPSRYIVVFAFAAVTLCAVILDAIKIQKFIVLLLIFMQGGVLWHAWKNYHAYDSTDSWLSPPELILYLPTKGYVLTLDGVQHYQNIFHGKGFADIAPYRFLRNNLQPYINILWDVEQLDTYPSRSMRRSNIAGALMRESFKDDDKTRWEKLLTLFSVRYVLSHKPITHTSLVQKTVIEDPWTRIYIYENTQTLPRVYLANEAVTATSVQDANEAMGRDSFRPGPSVLIEQPVRLSDTRPTGEVRIRSEQPERITISATGLSHEALLVVQQAWYPGWNAYIDGKKETVFPANIRMSAVSVPAGDHEIILRYEPKSVINGFWITLSTALGILLMGFIVKARQSVPDLRGRLTHTL